MSFAVRVYANADDALIAWRPDPWPKEWIGLALWKRDLTSGAETPINNRIPPKEGDGPVPDDGISSVLSPIRGCIWHDHSVSWGAFLADGGDPTRLYASLAGWKKGSKARDLVFWMGDPAG